MHRLSLVSLACLGLLTLHAEARTRQHVAPPHPPVDQLTEILSGAPLSSLRHSTRNEVVVHARQNQFYGNDNPYADTRSWGY